MPGVRGGFTFFSLFMNRRSESDRCQYVYRKGKKRGETCGALIRGENQTFCKKHLRVVSATYKPSSILNLNVSEINQQHTTSLIPQGRLVTPELLKNMNFFTVNLMKVSIPSIH